MNSMWWTTRARCSRSFQPTRNILASWATRPAVPKAINGRVLFTHHGETGAPAPRSAEAVFEAYSNLTCFSRAHTMPVCSFELNPSFS
jgi:hypothetical protein